MLITILSTIVVLGVLIFVHELGHFVTAKAVDIEVPRFSIGFGPKVIGFRRGETEYVISLLPLGGYVKMAGMEELEMIEGQPGITEPAEAPTKRTDGRDFDSKPLWARALVISAGVIMNILFAIVVFTGNALVYGVPQEPEPVIGGITEELVPEGAEALYGVPSGSRIVTIAGDSIGDWEDLRIALLTTRAGDTQIELAGREPITVALPSNDSARASLFIAIEPVTASPPRISQVVADGPAATAGLRANDLIVRAGGQPVETWQQFVSIVEANPGIAVPLVVERGGEQLNLAVTPSSNTAGSSGFQFGRIGVGGAGIDAGLTRSRPSPIRAIAYGTERTWDTASLVVGFLGGMFTGQYSPRNLGGPIEIGRISGQVARAGFEQFLSFMALFSVNLAVLNLLPIPVLDGGQLVFLGVEAVRGRPLSIEQRMRFTQVGFVIILMIMAWAIGNDILRVFGI